MKYRHTRLWNTTVWKLIKSEDIVEIAPSEYIILGMTNIKNVIDEQQAKVMVSITLLPFPL